MHFFSLVSMFDYHNDASQFIDPNPLSRRRGLMFMGAGVLAVLIGIIITVTTIYKANHGKAGFYAIYISE